MKASDARELVIDRIIAAVTKEAREGKSFVELDGWVSPETISELRRRGFGVSFLASAIRHEGWLTVSW